MSLKMWAVKNPLGEILAHSVSTNREDAIDTYLTCYTNHYPMDWSSDPSGADVWRLERQRGFRVVQVTVKECAHGLKS